MKGYADLADLPEDARIRAVVTNARAHRGDIIGVFVDDEPEKVERYQTKLRMAGLRIIDVTDGLVKRSKLIRCTCDEVVQ